MVKRSFYGSLLLILLSSLQLLGQTDQSTLVKIQELRLTSDFEPQNTAYIDLILDLAKEYVRENPDSTSILLKEGYDLSLKTNYKSGESKALSTYGYLYFEKGEKEKALEYNMKALKIAENNNLGPEKLKALNNMALDYSIQGEDALALTNFLKALEVANEISDEGMSININVNIGTLYSKNGDFQTATTFLDIARDLSLKSKDDHIISYTFISMASGYASMGDFDLANELIEKSIVFFEKNNIKDWLSHAYEQKGSIALDQEKYGEALGYLNKAEKLCDELKFTYGYALVYVGLAKCNLRLNKLNLAKEYGNKALKYATELNMDTSINDANSLLAQIYHELGDDKLAYEYQTTYIALYKASTDEKFKKGLGILRSKMEFENQKKQLIIQQDKEISTQKRYVYSAIGAMLLFLIFIILIYRNNKLQQRHTEELRVKQKILLQHEAELSQANETKDKLFSIIAHDLKGPVDSFLSLLQLSLTNTMTKEDFNIFIPKAINDLQGISVMLNNLLEWAKAQMKGIVVEQRSIEISSVIENTIKVLSPLAQKKLITINNYVLNTICFSDEDHLTIIIRNLISNAIKFTDSDGEITIKASAKDGFLEVSIADNGVGMSPETLALLFKNAHMNSTYGTNNEKGTGLGLFLCKEMAEGNGGKLWVTSELNVGTTVFFTVPLHEKV